MEKELIYVGLLCTAMFLVMAYVKRTSEYIVQDGVTYKHVGMARLNTSDEVYMPVYKRLKK